MFSSKNQTPWNLYNPSKNHAKTIRFPTVVNYTLYKGRLYNVRRIRKPGEMYSKAYYEYKLETHKLIWKSREA